MHSENPPRGGRILMAGLVALGVIAVLVLAGSGMSTRAASNSVRGAAAAADPPRHVSPAPAPSAPSPTSHPPAASRPGRPATPPTPKRGPGQRLVTLVNHMGQTIWPAVAADPKHPTAATGWRLAPGGSVTFVVQDHWDARVWARTGCAFNAAGHGHCVTGDCAGRFQCGSRWGDMPSTLAEFNLNAWHGMDFYDVSLVDGSNLPMYINHTGGRTPDKISPTGCAPAGCAHDANDTCPRALKVTHGGTVVACKSACVAFNTDQTCCRGYWAPRSRCVPARWPINSAAIFKRAEPFAYSYVNDDATSVFTCTGRCDYRITFGRSP